MKEPSLRSFVSSILRNLIDGIRDNRLAAAFSVIAFLAATAFSLSSQYDERPRYRQVILPDIEAAENKFFKTLEASETAPNEIWRLHYFLIAHQEAQQVLKVVSRRQPRTRDGIRAHGELIRYYDLVTEEMAIIRTEMSVDEKMDYLNEWKSQQDRLKPIRENWVMWVRS